MPTAKRSISSRVTIQNPRPRKYASAAERQKALRERFPTLCVRVEQEQADFMKRIADEQGRTLQDVHLAFIKYANGRGNQWLTQGLKGFAPLPRFEETPKDNPMKRKPTPAQIAARERFADMARSGAFKKKATKARKATDDTRTVSQKLKEYAINNAILERVESGQSVKSAYDAVLGKGAYERLAGEIYGEIRKTKSNPAKKTVSQKISQLTREGYPQKQAVAIALSEERTGKVKRNPISDIANIIYNQLGANRFAMMTGAKNFVAGDDFLMFSIGKNQSVYNKVRITLTPDDLYDVEFFKMNRLGDIAKEKKYEGMYAEQLPTLFTDVTGLYTSLGTMGRRSNPRASNPQARSVKHTGARNIAYAVQAKRMLAGGGAQFETVAGFPTKAQAQDYIDALLKSYPKGLTLRISAA